VAQSLPHRVPKLSREVSAKLREGFTSSCGGFAESKDLRAALGLPSMQRILGAAHSGAAYHVPGRRRARAHHDTAGR